MHTFKRERGLLRLKLSWQSDDDNAYVYFLFCVEFEWTYVVGTKLSPSVLLGTGNAQRAGDQEIGIGMLLRMIIPRYIL